MAILQSTVTLLLLCLSPAWSFAPISRLSHRGSSLFSVSAEEETRLDFNVPLSWEEMIRQAATTIEQGRTAGEDRQIVRILLPRDATSDDLGKYQEAEIAKDDSNLQLVPPDESWQGGIMQLYRSAAPTAQAILQKILSKSSAVPSRITEDRTVDESGVDGVGLWATEDESLNMLVQPTQESIDYLEDNILSDEDKLVVLLNPQWRQVDDALDAQSKSGGFLGNLASFLGGKGSTLQRLKEAGFTPTYTLEGYVCRGANVRLLKVLDGPWTVFCERDNGESYIPVGSSDSERPKYQQIEEMLNESGIGYKYARDMGWQDKI